MKYVHCVKLCQHNFTIVIVPKLLVHGHCSDFGLHSLPSRSSRCPRIPSLTKTLQLFWEPNNFGNKSIVAMILSAGDKKHVLNLELCNKTFLQVNSFQTIWFHLFLFDYLYSVIWFKWDSGRETSGRSNISLIQIVMWKLRENLCCLKIFVFLNLKVPE